MKNFTQMVAEYGLLRVVAKFHYGMLNTPNGDDILSKGQPLWNIPIEEFEKIMYCERLAAKEVSALMGKAPGALHSMAWKARKSADEIGLGWVMTGADAIMFMLMFGHWYDQFGEFRDWTNQDYLSKYPSPEMQVYYEIWSKSKGRHSRSHSIALESFAASSNSHGAPSQSYLPSDAPEPLSPFEKALREKAWRLKKQMKTLLTESKPGEKAPLGRKRKYGLLKYNPTGIFADHIKEEQAKEPAWMRAKREKRAMEKANLPKYNSPNQKGLEEELRAQWMPDHINDEYYMNLNKKD